ncbi:hypothetical protein [Serratia fonticola]|uniref:hypothetical protein n=1 Tax=Serratia fonticola TaxID=47917 RepID=UPI0021BB8743|nr:hypothetical protein [Serratia fonticola]
MKKTLLYIALSVAPFYASADNKCTPNLTKQDMCIFAKKLADEVKKELPIKNSDSLNLIEVKADNTRVILTGELKETRLSLENTYKIKGISIEEGEQMLRINSKKIACSSKPLASFINLGGVVQYEYVFSDGRLFDIVAITSCN